jgi:hypothetical protein
VLFLQILTERAEPDKDTVVAESSSSLGRTHRRALLWLGTLVSMLSRAATA